MKRRQGTQGLMETGRSYSERPEYSWNVRVQLYLHEQSGTPLLRLCEKTWRKILWQRKRGFLNSMRNCKTSSRAKCQNRGELAMAKSACGIRFCCFMTTCPSQMPLRP